MANFSSRGGELRFTDFVDIEHLKRVTGAIKRAGIELEVYCDPLRSDFINLRRHAQKRPEPFEDPEWRGLVSSVSSHVLEVGEVINESTPYGSCGFGLAAPNPDWQVPVWHGSGYTWPTPRQPQLHFLDESSLRYGMYPANIVPLGQMAVTLQYNECI